MLSLLLVMVQVLTLAHQLDPNILRRGVSAGLWDDLRHLLDMLPQPDAEGDPRLGLASCHKGPSILATDAAVTAVEVSFMFSIFSQTQNSCYLRLHAAPA